MIPENWNDIQAVDSLENNILSLGGHENIIIDVSYHTTKEGKEALRVVTDIKENSKFDNYCQKLLDSRTTDDERWPNEGTKYFSLGEKGIGYFKHFVEVLEKSNNRFLNIVPGEKLELTQFKGMKFAGIYGLQEYKNKDGEIKTSINLVSFTELSKVNEVPIPDVKLENGMFIPYEEYMNSKRGVEKQEPVQEQMNFEEDSHEIVDTDVEAPEYPFD